MLQLLFFSPSFSICNSSCPFVIPLRKVPDQIFYKPFASQPRVLRNLELDVAASFLEVCPEYQNISVCPSSCMLSSCQIWILESVFSGLYLSGAWLEMCWFFLSICDLLRTVPTIPTWKPKSPFFSLWFLISFDWCIDINWFLLF